MLKIRSKNIAKMIVKTYKNWMASDPFQMSAAVSYYALFSFPALLIIVIQVTGLFYDQAQVKAKILREIGGVLGKDASTTVDSLMQNVIIQDQTALAIIIGISTLLYGATGMFVALQKSLNSIWNVTPNPKEGFLKLVKDRLFSLGLILIIGFLLLISLVLTALISAISDWIQLNMPNVVLGIIYVINFIIPLGLITVLFGLIFKILPDVTIKWKYVWLGAFVTSLLFSIGKFALGVYFGSMDPGSAFGAAGTVVLIMLWVSYSSLILFFGAEFTKVYSESFNAPIEAQEHAKFINVPKKETL